MHHPYQCIQICKRSANDGSDANFFLLAASGPTLYSVHLSTGAIVSSWPSEDELASSSGRQDEANPASKDGKPLETSQELPNIIKIKATTSGRYAVVVTAEDKAVSVFEVSADGQLCHLSRRMMPKRPSAIDIMPDQQTILVGDKFGDVYQLPLLPKTEASNDSAPKSDENHIRKYAPAASEKTVHSKANLRALQEQLRQAEKGNVKKTKETPDFEHTLLLGHVSMLTDLLIAQHATAEGVTRTYIITADRDEHIRVSRGPPQSYVTEGYCLGHDEFASKLCLLNPRFPQLLVSGGADTNLRFWDWTKQESILNYSTRDIIQTFLPASRHVKEAPTGDQYVISGVWGVPQPEDGFTLFVSYEGLSALFSAVVLRIPEMLAEPQDPRRRWLAAGPSCMPGNVIDLTFFNDYLIVSVDNIHKLDSTTDIDESDEPRSRLYGYKVRQSDTPILWFISKDEYGNPKPDDLMTSLLADLNRQITFENVLQKVQKIEGQMYYHDQGLDRQRVFSPKGRARRRR